MADYADAYDLRTEDVKLSDRIAALERRVDELIALIHGSGIQTHAAVPNGRAGVLIIRKPDDTVQAQHIAVRHTPLMNANDAVVAVQDHGFAFVQAGAASTVLDALGVEP
jgi:hypothetical protein